LLLEGKAEVDLQDYNGRTPLWYAAERGHEAIVKLLLDAGADIEPKDEDGQTPLSRAAEGGHISVVKLLLENKADVESKDNQGWIPLWWAALQEHEAVMEILLVAAGVENKDDYDWATLRSAIENERQKKVRKLPPLPTQPHIITRTREYQPSCSGRVYVY
jgi:ankyrin repeat protein